MRAGRSEKFRHVIAALAVCALAAVVLHCSGGESGSDGAAKADGVRGEITADTGDPGEIDVVDVKDVDVCVPECEARVCGSDGCQGTCGTCASEQFCNAGVCEDSCASDEGCDEAGAKKCIGGNNAFVVCGELAPACFKWGAAISCDGTDQCMGGDCVPLCIPQCYGKQCGDDGCYGACGTCGQGEFCNEGACTETCVSDADCLEARLTKCDENWNAYLECEEVEPDCLKWGDRVDCEVDHVCEAGACVYQPWCGDGSCDIGLNENCATCAADCGCGCGEACQAGTCVFTACEGRACGTDGCGGTCGDCPDGHECQPDGSCMCFPQCDGKDCGNDGCGGQCGDLAGNCAGAQEACVEGNCVCLPACEDKDCGPDGCGGTCGDCGEGGLCANGVCEIDKDQDGVPTPTDCDDSDPEVNPNRDEIPYDAKDNDCDQTTSDTDFDGDGYDSMMVGGTDCNDANAQAYPNATEFCGDWIDQDCDGHDLVCPSGQTCEYETGQCEPDPTCGGCPPGQQCNAETGQCESDPTCGGGCPAGQVCHEESGSCFVDTGCGLGCPPGKSCNPDTGLCYVDVTCGGCPQGQVCNITSGLCEIKGDCGGCLMNELCNPFTGLCDPNPVCGDDFCVKPEGMVKVSGVYVDKFEASRCTDDDQMACSVAGALPWSSVSRTSAENACKRARKRLCSAETLATACDGVAGAGGSFFPYGNQYQPAMCNTEELVGTETEGHPYCKNAAYDVYNTVGNVAEWVVSATDVGGVATAWSVAGGDYESGALAKCNLMVPSASITVDAKIGFRCCVSPDDDQDGDGFSAAEECNDVDAAVNPEAPEVCNGMDDDCNGATDDTEDLDGDGYNKCDDCNDALASFHPGATDVVGDGKDQNCDGLDGVDADGDGLAGEASGGEDCDDDDPAVPSCEGKDAGSADGCGGTCGACGCGEVYVGWACEFTACAGKTCGSDGCGGSCGGCPEDHGCVENQCQPLAEAGEPCVENASCFDGLCVEDVNGQFCADTCLNYCGDDSFRCALVMVGGDPAYYCIPRYANLCRPCLSNNDCQGAQGNDGALCVDWGHDGAFCGASCAAQPCPTGFFCQAVPSGRWGILVKQCLPSSGQECECTPKYEASNASTACYVDNPWGTCFGHRYCGASGLTACDAKVPAKEVCNGVDDDCDGHTDEAYEIGTPPACPAQQGLCLGATTRCEGSAGWLCDDSTYLSNDPGYEPDEQSCDGLDNDCDGQTDEGLLSACGGCGAVPDELCNGLDDDCDGQTDELTACNSCGSGPAKQLYEISSSTGILMHWNNWLAMLDDQAYLYFSPGSQDGKTQLVRCDNNQVKSTYEPPLPTMGSNSIITGADGKLHIAACGKDPATQSNYVKVHYYRFGANGVQEEHDVIAGAAHLWGQPCVISYAEGTPWVAHWTASEGEKKLVKMDAYGDWDQEGTLDAYDDYGYQVVVDEDGAAHLAFRNTIWDYASVYYRKDDGSATKLCDSGCESYESCSTGCSSPAMKKAPDGTIHVVYSRGGTIYYRRLNGSSWSYKETIDVGSGANIAFMPDMRPVVAYIRDGKELWVATRREGEWQSEKLYWTAATGASFSYAAIGVDSSGRYHLGLRSRRPHPDGLDDYVAVSYLMRCPTNP